jgi:hypothetical protein
MLYMFNILQEIFIEYLIYMTNNDMIFKFFSIHYKWLKASFLVTDQLEPEYNKVDYW